MLNLKLFISNIKPITKINKDASLQAEWEKNIFFKATQRYLKLSLNFILYAKFIF